MADAGVPVEVHLARVLEAVRPLPAVEVDLPAALGRVLAADVTAAVALPRFDHAAMDGFAVRAGDVADAAPERPAVLPVAGTVAAGDTAVPALPPGAALRIMTGAVVPAGADAVVPFEWTDRGDPVQVRRPVAAGRHIRRAGEDVVRGAAAVPAGTVLAPRHLGLLAAVGRPAVAVRPAPRVAVLATGAELVSGGADPADPPGRVPDVNTVALVAAARAAGADATAYGPVADDPDAFLALLATAAAAADLVVTTGGISAGDHDVVKAALRESSDPPGVWFGPVAVKPGRPQGAGSVAGPDGRRVPLVTLPGTPVAAYASFLLFALPALRALAGLPVQRRRAVLAAPVAAAPDRTVLLPGTYDAAGRISVLPGHAGHSQRLLAGADALLVVPPGGRLLPEGETVEVLPLDPEEGG